MTPTTGNENGPTEPTIDDLLKAIEGNRTRLRTFTTMTIAVCGMLLSSSFVALFFILNQRPRNVPYLVLALLFSTVASLALSITLSIITAMPLLPQIGVTRVALVDTLANFYHREHKWAIASSVFLLLGIAMFLSALGVLAWFYKP